jgi:hypothetical protein
MVLDLLDSIPFAVLAGFLSNMLCAIERKILWRNMEMQSGEKKYSECVEMQDMLKSNPSLKVLLIAPSNPSTSKSK